jgi:hypothetical protein
MSEHFETATFASADLTEQGLDEITRGDVVNFGKRAMLVRDREDNWSLESGMTTTLTFTQYIPFPYQDC